ncbi:hypothetical protein LBMAG53_06830 [Planctomycetota bacterium]|nr:hypothetical protein LBMAG53_06830 [Planctomycetota bacterium]
MSTALTVTERLSRIFFAPVYFFIDRVRFAKSLLLLLLLLPDGYVAWLLVAQTTKDVNFSRKESVGVAYISPARDLLAKLQALRVSRIGGAPGSPTSDIDAAIAVVDQAEQLHGGELGTAAVWASIKADWAKIKTTGDDATLAALTGRIAGELIVNTVGNNSNLILDPDLDSYWMMDAYVFKLPTLGELVAGTAANASTVADGAAITNAQRADLAALTGLIRTTTSDLINVDLKTAIADNESDGEGRTGNRRLRAALESHFQTTAKSLEGFADLIRDQALVPAQPSLQRETLRKAAATLIGEVQSLQVAVAPELDRLCVERADRYRQTRFVGIIVFIVAALLISYVFNGFTSSVQIAQKRIEDENARLQKDILGLLEVVSEAADGNLTVRAKVTEGTLGNVADAFNQMMESWQQLMAAITQQLDRTNQAVAELGKASAAMAKGASNQTAAVAAAAGAVTRMSQEIGLVSTNAEEAASSAKRTQASALQGSTSVQAVVQGMESLRSLVQAGAKKIKTLGERSMEINSIVSTIARISEQTNMLALNAAIEAARAGDQGRGFSVVADEVRKLAERTAAATQEIDKLVKAIQAETNESVAAIERQTQVVEEEGRAVANAGAVLTRIEAASGESTNLASSIALVAKTQVTDAKSVVNTMQGVSGIARETEQGAAQSLQIAQSLGDLSQQLRTAIGRFKVG